MNLAIENLPTIKLTSKMKDRTNMKRGNLTFLKPSRKNGNKIMWWAQCICGEILEVYSDNNTQISCKTCSNKQKKEKLKGRNSLDLTNQKFGRLTALYQLEERKNNCVMWHCICDCKKELDVQTTSLTSGNTKSCGCLKKEHAYFTTLSPDLIGQRFGKLTVKTKTDKRQYEKVIWECQCDCGNIVYLNTGRLTSGNDISCGCIKTSTGAKYIFDILTNNSINFKKEYSFKDFSKYLYDFAIIDKNDNVIRLIEFDGEQHYRSSGGWNTLEQVHKTQQRDQIKNEYALSHNIPLVRIPYWERDNITLEMIMGDQYLFKRD